eukprot:scaffold17008_cov124-Isochrysis_galbana.AAC.2
MTSVRGQPLARTCPSRSDVSRRWPQGVKMRCETGDRWPSLSTGAAPGCRRLTANTSPNLSDHTPTASPAALAGAKATQPTLLLLVHVPMAVWVATSHARTTLSSPLVSRYWPLTSKHAHRTTPVGVRAVGKRGLLMAKSCRESSCATHIHRPVGSSAITRPSSSVVWRVISDCAGALLMRTDEHDLAAGCTMAGRRRRQCEPCRAPVKTEPLNNPTGH